MPRVVQAVLSADVLCRLLRSRRVVAIALVDLNYLRSSRQSAGAKLLSGAMACMPSALGLGAVAFKRKAYRGHYVVLCGHLPASDEVVYRDPAGPPGHLGYTTSRQLDAARGASGTDEDLLLVSLPVVDERR